MKGLKLFGKINFTELFPTKWSGFIFIAYMALFINQGLLVTASQQADSGYSYNTVVAVMMTEVIKLALSLLLYILDNNIFDLYKDVKTHVKVFYRYFVPAFLYCLYNNLTFVNLSLFDPTSYYLLLQLRVVITGVLFQILFNKKLSAKQWLSLVLLTAGCMVKQLKFDGLLPTPLTTSLAGSDNTVRAISKGSQSLLHWSMLFILVQVVCSCLAGVYSEFLLKAPDSGLCNIHLQNMFMYLDSVACNVGLLVWKGQLPVLWDTAELNHMIEIKVILVVLNNAAIGIVTSFFLRSLNSIVKTFASALELMFTALLTWLLFDIPVYTNTVCAILIVSVAVVMYSQNPVINIRQTKKEVV